MKTPRQILLEQNRHMEGELDALRRDVVQQLGKQPAAPDAWAIRFARTLWVELFYSGRRAWLTLGSAWCAIILLNIAASEAPTTVAQTITPGQMQAALAQRQRLFTELNAPSLTPAEPPKSAVPNRRSERHHTLFFA